MGLSDSAGAGGEVYDYQLLKHLAELGVRIRVILPWERPCGHISGATIDRVTCSRGRYANFVFARASWHAYQHEPFDLMRIHSSYYVGLAGLLFRMRYARVPIVLHHLHVQPGALHREMLRLSLACADAVITISQFSRRQLLDCYGIDSERVYVVPCGVSDFYTTRVPDVALPESHPQVRKQIILGIGSLKARKNFSFLIRVFKKVHEQLPSSQLVIIGDGPEKRLLSSVVKELGLSESVLLTGFVSEEGKLNYLNRADVLVSTSVLEGFGLSVAEAMGCGKPVVVSDAGSLPEIVEPGVTGYMVSLSDLNGFAEAILRLLDDPSLRAQMGQAGAKRVRSLFRWDQAAERVREIYEQTISCRRNR